MNDLALFNDLFDFGDEGYNYGLPSFTFKKAIQGPKVDVKETKDAYTLQMDLPGKTDKDVNIELDRNVLTISSENKTEKEEKKEAENEAKAEKKDETKWLIRERSYSRFSRSFTLPEDVDSENLSAEVKNGVLTVNMPRRALSAPKRIAINCA